MSGKGVREKHVLIIMSLASFLSPFMSNAINLGVPAIGKEFNGNATALSWIVTGYILISAVAVLPSGRLGDIFGRKRIFSMGLVIFTAGSLLCASAGSIQALLLFRVMQGLGSAMSYSTATAIVGSVYPPDKRGSALGIITTATYLGFAIGPFLGGALTYHYGWRTTFIFAGLLGGLVLILSWRQLKGEWAEARGERFDLRGTLLYIIGMVTFIYGLSSITAYIWSKYILVLGLFFLWLFGKYESSIDHPILNIGFFAGNTGFLLANLAALIYFISTATVNYLLSLHLQIVSGYNAQTAGLLLLTQPLIMALLSSLAGHLSDRCETRFLATGGIAAALVGLTILSLIQPQTPVWLLLTALIIIGGGSAFFSSPNTNSVISAVPRKYYGVASSTLGTMRNCGQAVSIAVSSLIFSLYLKKESLWSVSAFRLDKGIRTAFIAFTLVCIWGVIASFARGASKIETDSRP